MFGGNAATCWPSRADLLRATYVHGTYMLHT